MIRQVSLLFVLTTVVSMSVFAFQAGTKSSQDTKAAYTAPEYNTYMAAIQEKEPQQRITALDTFVQKYPNSSLLPYVYSGYSMAYEQLKDYPKTIEYSDRLLALGNAVDKQTQLGAIATRTSAFMLSFRNTDSDKERELAQARDAATRGIALLGEIPRPLNVTAEQFAQEEKTAKAFYDSVIGYTSLELKDFDGAVAHLKSAAETYQNDPVVFLRLGIAYLHATQPNYMDGFWALSRSVSLKGPAEQQTQKYLVDQIQSYQQCGCRNLVEEESSGLVSAALKQSERPNDLLLPSAAELQKVRESAGPILDDLQKDDEQSKKLWLAVCGLEFPEVAVKILESSHVDDTFVFKAFRSPVLEEIQKARDANMEIKVASQPGLERLKAGDYVRFHGTLSAYQHSPFLLTWDKAQINLEDVPPEVTKKQTKHKGQKPQ